MNKIFLPFIITAITLGSATKADAQQTFSGRTDKLYSMSGAGFSFPVGENSDFMRPKFSTTLGVNLGLGQGGLFLYPKASLHVFGYDKIAPEPGYAASLTTGRATTYLLNLAIGYRKMLNKFAFYGFVGGGGGFVLTPRVTVDASTNTVDLSNKTNTMGIIEPGLGIEYNLGGANLFIESSFMQGLGKIQNAGFATVPISIGIKPNLSKILK